MPLLSPKSQDDDVTSPVDVSVKLTVSGANPPSGGIRVNPATGAAGGAGVRRMAIDDAAGAPPLSVTEAVIVWLPTESVPTEIDTPVPMVPSALELH